MLEEFEHRIVFIRTLFRDEFIVLVENLYIHLLIWKYILLKNKRIVH